MEDDTKRFVPQFRYEINSPFTSGIRTHIIILAVFMGTGLLTGSPLYHMLQEKFPSRLTSRWDFEQGFKYDIRDSRLHLHEEGWYAEDSSDEVDLVNVSARYRRFLPVNFSAFNFSDDERARIFTIGTEGSEVSLIERTLETSNGEERTDAIIELSVHGGPVKKNTYFDLGGDGTFDLLIEDRGSSWPTGFIRMNGEAVAVEVGDDDSYFIDGVPCTFEDGEWKLEQSE